MWKHTSALLLAAPLAALLLAQGGSAIAPEDSASGPDLGARQVVIENVDPRTISWFDAVTGKPIENPIGELGGLGLSVPSSRLAAAVTTSSCAATTYKVLFYMPYDTSLKSACYTGSGTWTGPTDVYHVVGVCPGAHRGQIHYTVYSGATYWSTLRGPYANNSQCYYFDPVVPTDYDKVYLASQAS